MRHLTHDAGEMRATQISMRHKQSGGQRARESRARVRAQAFKAPVAKSLILR